MYKKPLSPYLAASLCTAATVLQPPLAALMLPQCETFQPFFIALLSLATGCMAQSACMPAFAGSFATVWRHAQLWQASYPKVESKQKQSGDLVPRAVSCHVQNSEEDVASSLLGTPYLATQASNPRAPVTTPRRLASAPAQQDNQQVDSYCLPATLHLQCRSGLMSIRGQQQQTYPASMSLSKHYLGGRYEHH